MTFKTYFILHNYESKNYKDRRDNKYRICADCTWAIINEEPVAFIGQTKINCSKITNNGNEEAKREIIHYPAWSLHRLLCMLDYDNAATFNIMPNLAYEDVIATISLRIDCGVFNKEYLKQ